MTPEQETFIKNQIDIALGGVRAELAQKIEAKTNAALEALTENVTTLVTRQLNKLSTGHTVGIGNAHADPRDGEFADMADEKIAATPLSELVKFTAEQKNIDISTDRLWRLYVKRERPTLAEVVQYG